MEVNARVFVFLINANADRPSNEKLKEHAHQKEPGEYGQQAQKSNPESAAPLPQSGGARRVSGPADVIQRWPFQCDCGINRV